MDIKKFRFLIVSFLISLLIYLIYNFLFYKNWNKQIAEKEMRNKELDSKVASAQQAARDLPRLEEEIRKLEYKWKLAQRLLPEEEEIDEVIRLVTQRAMESGIKILDMKRGTPVTSTISTGTPQTQRGATTPPAQPVYLMEIPLNFKFSATFHSFALFLSELSTLSRLVTTWDVAIQSKEDKEYSIEGNFMAKIYTFTFQPVATTPARK